MEKLVTILTASCLALSSMAQIAVPQIQEKSVESFSPSVITKKAFSQNSNKAGTIIWGAGSTNGAALGEFATPFTFSDTSTTNWQVKSINQTGGSVTPGNAYWVRNLTGYSAGAYWSSTTPHTSASQANGSALFDSDFLDNNGVQNAFGTGTSPSAHKGELISPPIDLTGNTNQALTIKFFSFYRNFQIANYTVGLSVDGGTTYTDVNILNITSNITQQTVSATFPTITAGISNLTNCRIKFTFDGDYYFAFIDDVSIEAANPIDLTIEEADKTGNTITDDYKDLQIFNNRHFSVNQLMNHHFRFGANVKNQGFRKIFQTDNAQLVVDIQRGTTGNWTSVFKDSISIDTLNALGVGRPFLDTIHSRGWATVGDYRAVYTTKCSLDANPVNDTLFQFFSLNDDQYFSKVDVTNGFPSFTRQIFPGGGPFQKFEFGSMFSIPNGKTNNLVIDSVSLIYYTPSTYSGANSVVIKANVYEFNDGANGATKNGQIDNSGSKNELRLVATGTKTVTNMVLGGYAGTHIVLTDTATNLTRPRLEDNKVYYVSLELDAALNSIANFNSTNMIWFGASGTKSYSMNYIGIDSSNIIPLPSTLFLTDASSNSTSNQIGFGMDIVPSFGIKTSNICQNYSAQIASSSNVSCNGGTDGTITTSVSGGLAPYSYLWSNNATTSSISSASAGKHFVTISDLNGCSVLDSAVVTQPSALANTLTSSNVSCNGGTNGSATATVSGGTAPYTYQWSNAATTGTASNLAAGTYAVTVTDANGCFITGTKTITAPVILMNTITSTNVSCNGGVNGTATSTVSGGTAPYTYAWSNSATTTTVSNLAAGAYAVTVTDANGCFITGTKTITAPAILMNTITVTNVTCNGGANGTATSTVSGGTAPYTYAWSNAATASTTSNLAAGTYVVTVTDANGCFISGSTSISQPIPLASSVSQIACNSFTWSQNNMTYTSSGSYNDTIQNGNGCDSVVTLNLTINSNPTADAGTNVSICNGQAVVIGGSPTGPAGSTYIWSNATSLSNATVSNPIATPTMNTTYTVTVTNGNSCTSTDQVTVSVNQSTVSTVAQTACGSYTWAQNSMTYSVSGMYNDTIPNAANCDSVITLNLTIDNAIYTVTQNNGVLTADQTGATYRWLDCNNAFVPISGATAQSYTATANGNYAVEVTKGACVDTSSCITVVINSITDRNGTANRFEIYPNPSDGNIVLIHSLTNNNNQIAQIFDIKGQLVYETKLINEQSNHNLYFLENGMYFIKVGTEMKKFIVSK